jgi:cytidylate kinase
MSDPATLTVAIDGPAASGKSTASKRLAAALGLALVDTGALYRCVALAAKRACVPWDDDAGLERVVNGLDVGFRFDGQVNRVFLAGEDVSEAIRLPTMSVGASTVSARPVVRAGLMQLQRGLAARPPGAVLEGRDIGTVVLPAATVKFFLTASADVRARRRFDELVRRGESPDYDEVLAAEQARDDADSTRAISPLRQAEDAVLVDSSSLDSDEVLAQMLEVVRQRTKPSTAPDPL